MARVSAEKDKYLDKLNQTVLSGFMATGLALGAKLGLFKAFGTDAVTSTELADKTNCKERYVREWLKHMVMCDVINVDETGRLFSLPSYKRDALVDRTGLVYGLGSVHPYCLVAHQEVIACFEKDGPMGVPFETVRPSLDQYTEMCKDAYKAAPSYLTSHVPNLGEQLESGIRVGEIGSGQGNLLMELAKQYPNSSFVGFDLSAPLVQKTRDVVADQKLNNVEVHVQDVCKLPEQWDNAFDFVIMRGVLHDIAYPVDALTGIFRSLKPGGRMSILEINVSEDLNKALEDPAQKSVGQMMFMISIYHCLTQALCHDGSAGLGTAPGKENIVRIIKSVGFLVKDKLDVVDAINFHIQCAKPT